MKNNQTCPLCGMANIPFAVTQCPQCDADLTSFKVLAAIPEKSHDQPNLKPKRRWVKWLLIISLILFLGFMMAMTIFQYYLIGDLENQNTKLKAQNLKLELQNTKFEIIHSKLDVQNSKMELHNLQFEVQNLRLKTRNEAVTTNYTKLKTRASRLKKKYLKLNRENSKLKANNLKLEKNIRNINED